MLNAERIVAFVPTTDAIRARTFYQEILGLLTVVDDGFALVLDANGTMIRVTRVQSFEPQQFTILGWDVKDIDEAVSRLCERGVRFENYSMAGQDNRGHLEVSKRRADRLVPGP